jgi:hypothetical protein
MTLIKYKARMSQPKDFKNLFINGFTPTDIDFVYDVAGKKYIIGELKLVNAPLPEGQRRALHYLADNLVAAGCDVCLMVAEHMTAASEPIDVGNCEIVKCATMKNGTSSDKMYLGMTVADASHDFLGIDPEENF